MDYSEETIPCFGNGGQSNTGATAGIQYPVRKVPSSLHLRILPTFSIISTKTYSLPRKILTLLNRNLILYFHSLLIYRTNLRGFPIFVAQIKI